MRKSWNDDKFALRATVVPQVRGHLHRKEPILFTVDDEHGNWTGTQCLLRDPDVWNEEGEASWKAGTQGGLLQGREGSAHDQHPGGNLRHDCRGDAAAERKAKNGDRARGEELLQEQERRDRVSLTLGCADESGTASVTGIIEDEGCDALCGEELLYGKPVLHCFADAMTKEHSSLHRAIGRPCEHRIEDVVPAPNWVTGERNPWSGYGRVATKPAKDSVAHHEGAADAGHRNGEGDSLCCLANLSHSACR